MEKVLCLIDMEDVFLKRLPEDRKQAVIKGCCDLLNGNYDTIIIVQSLALNKQLTDIVGKNIYVNADLCPEIADKIKGKNVIYLHKKSDSGAGEIKQALNKIKYTSIDLAGLFIDACLWLTAKGLSKNGIYTNIYKNATTYVKYDDMDMRFKCLSSFGHTII